MNMLDNARAYGEGSARVVSTLFLLKSTSTLKSEHQLGDGVVWKSV